jgi:hypothetical protein
VRPLPARLALPALLALLALSACGTQTAPAATDPSATPPGSPVPGTIPSRPPSATSVPSASPPSVAPPADQPWEPHPVVYDATRDAELIAEVPVAEIRPGTRTSLALATPGLGLAWPQGKVTATGVSASEVRLRYDGPGWVNPKADARTGFVSALTHAGDARRVTLRLDVTLDPGAGTGTVDAWAGTTHAAFASHEAPRTALPVANAVLDAVRAEDWRALYRLADPLLRPGTEEEFVRAFEGQGAIVVHRVEPTGPATYTPGTAPATATVPIVMDTTIAGRRRHQVATLVLTYSRGAWRLSTTR